jgi:hypothetical protein
MSLWAQALSHRGRPLHKWTNYFPHYEAHFARFVNRPVTFIEIGVGRGGSLQMWKRYLGPHAQIVGLDIRPECKDLEGHHIAVRIGDQSDPTFLAAVLDEFGAPDVVLDDGSHVMSDIAATFAYLYPRMSPNGVYFVEDLHCAYAPRYGGGLRREGTFIELAKDLVDELNGGLLLNGTLEPTEFTSSTLSMHFYAGCIVFQRGRHDRGRSIRRGSPAKGDPEVKLIRRS